MSSSPAKPIVTRAAGRFEVSSRVLTVLAIAGGLSLAGYVVRLVLDPTAHNLVDLTAYRIAAQRVLDGVALYDSPLIGTTTGVFEFVYPPFAALVFLPAALLGEVAAAVASVLVNLLLLAVLLGVTWRAAGHAPGPRLLALTAASTAVAVWVHPVFETLAFGQVNLLLAVLVLVDLVAVPARSRWRGVLLGIAIGIKLTPAFFVLLLVVTRQGRAAATAVASAVATMALGLLVLPGDSLRFWSGAFVDPARVGVPEHPGNQTLRGAVARLLGVGQPQQLLWFALAVVVAVAGLWVARRLWLAGSPVAATLLCALTATAVSPFSWVHHWVWWAPVLVVLLHQVLQGVTAADPLPGRAVPGGTVSSGAALVAPAVAGPALLVTVLVVAHGWIALFVPEVMNVLAIPAWPGTGLEIVYQHAYLWLTVGLIVAAGGLRRPLRVSDD